LIKINRFQNIKPPNTTRLMLLYRGCPLTSTDAISSDRL
jgi:hypothetical protein